MDKTKKENRILSLWILLLSLGAGYVNITTILKFNQPVSHMTGNASALAQGIFAGEAFLVGRLFSVLLFFLLGSTLAGMLFCRKTREPRACFSLIPMLGGIFAYLLKDRSFLLYYLAFLMGLQNTLFIDYRGYLIRSTHLTGYLSDVGFELGSLLAGRKNDSWKISFYLVSFLSFVLGGILAAYLSSQGVLMEGLALTYIFIGLYYLLVRRKQLFKGGPSEGEGL